MIPNNKLSVLVVGASGHLGCMITRELIARGDMIVSVLVQDKEKCKDLCTEITNSGGKCFVGDVLKPDTIKGITKNIHTVISTLIGDNDVMIDGQSLLLEDAIQNNVKRFVPSDFSLNIWGLKTGTHYLVDQRLRFRQRLEKTQIKGLHFTDGMFMETYFWLAEKQGFNYWGDINTKIDLIAMKDMAKFVAAAVGDRNIVGDVMVTGCEVSTKQIVEIYNKATNKNVEAMKLGTLDDLRSRIKEMKEQGNSFEALQLGFSMLMFDGRGKITKRMNEMFPSVKITSLEDFIKGTQGKSMMDYTMYNVAQHIDKQMLMQYSC
jgi:nucleoside-diphosphate-sugar epimerase